MYREHTYLFQLLTFDLPHTSNPCVVPRMSRETAAGTEGMHLIPITLLNPSPIPTHLWLFLSTPYLPITPTIASADGLSLKLQNISCSRTLSLTVAMPVLPYSLSTLLTENSPQLSHLTWQLQFYIEEPLLSNTEPSILPNSSALVGSKLGLYSTFHPSQDNRDHFLLPSFLSLPWFLSPLPFSTASLSFKRGFYTRLNGN